MIEEPNKISVMLWVLDNNYNKFSIKSAQFDTDGIELKDSASKENV